VFKLVVESLKMGAACGTEAAPKKFGKPDPRMIPLKTSKDGSETPEELAAMKAERAANIEQYDKEKAAFMAK
jgi:hypothetical protein